MKVGYKKTKVGEIPVDWDVENLGSLGEFKNGINKSKEDFGHGFPFVNLSNVFGVSVVSDKNLGLVNSTVAERKDYELIEGDVLFIRSSVKPSGVGLTALVSKTLVNTVYSGFIIRFRDNGFFDKNFKRHCFYEEGFRQQLLNKSTISANTNINQKALNTLVIPLPPLPEQQKIASILTAADEKIAAIQTRIESTEQLKKGLMQRLLTKGIGHSEFKDSKLGKIPKSWEVIQMNEVLEVLTDFESNGSFAGVKANVKIFNSKNYAWYVRATDLENNKPLSDVKFVDEKSYNFLKKTTLFGNELLITKRGEIGKLYFFEKNNLDIKTTLAPNLYLLKFNTKARSKFLYYYFKSPHGNKSLKRINASTTLGALYKDDMKKLHIPLVPILEQDKIVSIFSTIDEKIEILTQKKSAYETLKKGLMQKLLTGKIRVKI